MQPIDDGDSVGFLKGNTMQILGFGLLFSDYNIYVVDDFGNLITVDAMQSIVSTRDVMHLTAAGEIPNII